MAACALLAACAGPSTAVVGAGETGSGTGTGTGSSITVFAAASLQGTFTELAERFEAENPGVTVQLSFAGSSDLATQIAEGAPADVFASADESTLSRLTDAGLIDEASAVDFATNVLTIAVPPGNPGGVSGFADLASPDVTTVVCAPQVPCGAATAALEEATGVDIAPVSEESSVTDVLGKVTSGEADAGLVYVTDVIAAGDAVEEVAFPESTEVVNTYPIATVAASAHADTAAGFVRFVTGSTGRAVLEAAGFGAPR
ncbi:molybdate ABC transporter substrate-binding protein [Herbiconiux liukaitaii]|uniref:molybdate ABC transporter substrate-binding protein n=1 Tax=Herbiconiux liukaitaii TaxID=3342799 RepID=UPI0035BB207C